MCSSDLLGGGLRFEGLPRGVQLIHGLSCLPLHALAGLLGELQCLLPRRLGRLVPAAAKFHSLVKEGPGIGEPCPLLRPGILLFGELLLQLIECPPRLAEDGLAADRMAPRPPQRQSSRVVRERRGLGACRGA